MKNISLHETSYEKFWSRDFPQLFSRWLGKYCSKLSRDALLTFVPRVQVENSDISSVNYPCQSGEEDAYCRGKGESLLQDLFINVKLSQYGELHRIYMGRVPRMTPRGTFVINGEERAFIAQLVKSPGVFFSKEEKVEKVQVGFLDRQYYDVKKTYSIAEIVPESGTWIRFEVGVSDPDSLALIPLHLQERATRKDNVVRVYLRRGEEVRLQTFMASLGLEDEKIKTFLGSPFEQNWSKSCKYEISDHPPVVNSIAEALKIFEIDRVERGDEDVKEKIQERILEGNQLGGVGRWQINRRLRKIPGFHVKPDDITHLTAEDILGIVRYFLELFSGNKGFDIDDSSSLSNKRVRLIDVFLEEHVQIAFFRIKSALDAFLLGEGRMDEDEFVKRLQKTINRNDKFSSKILELFSLHELSRLVPQDNYLGACSLGRRITLSGPGAIQSAYVRNVRDLHWSHYGRICSLDTPQGAEIGLTLSVALRARVNRLGILEAPCRKVEIQEGIPTVGHEIEFLTPDAEEDLKAQDKWVSYYDQMEKFKRGEKVLARRGREELVRVDASKVVYIDAYPEQPYSLAALMIPFLKHNDANRALMACNMIKQATPLQEVEAPLVSTGYEKAITEGIDVTYGKKMNDVWAFGRNLLVAYTPWYGYNFEDAVVLSDTASKKLEAVIYKERIEVSVDPGEVSTKDIPLGPGDGRQLEKLDDKGLIEEGSEVEEGQILLGMKRQVRAEKSWADKAADKLVLSLFNVDLSKKRSLDPDTWKDTSYRVPRGKKGRIVKAAWLDEEKKRAVIELELVREMMPGDKLANRHGGKGVVSVVLNDEEMPYFADSSSDHDHDGIGNHRHVEIMLNPLGVISRINLGQIFETHLCWLIRNKNSGDLPELDKISIDYLKESLAADTQLKDGKVVLYDPKSRKSLDHPVTVGYQYLMRLSHHAEMKIHGRSAELNSYSAVTQQPLHGKPSGGQRFGEMEAWALEAYNARYLLQELLTLKSDSVIGREFLLDFQRRRAHRKELTAETPEVLRLLVFLLRGIGLDLRVYDKNNEPLSLLRRDTLPSLDQIASLEVAVATGELVRDWSSGEVTEPDYGDEAGGMNDKGLFSQTIFGPLIDYVCKCKDRPNDWSANICFRCKIPIGEATFRRERMGHITLAMPVFNILFLDQISTLIGISSRALHDWLLCKPKIRLENPLEFFWFLVTHSSDSRFILKNHLGVKDENEFARVSNRLAKMEVEDLNRLINLPLEKLLPISVLTSLLKGLTKDNLKKLKEDVETELGGLIEEGKKVETQNRLKRRLKVIGAFIRSKTKPIDTILSAVPVIPPAYRPPYEIEDGRYVWGDLNELYQQLSKQNLETGILLKAYKVLAERKGAEAGAAIQVIFDAVRRLQNQVDALINNQRTRPPATGSRGRRLKSITGYLRGKEGLFRANMLGKRVDYSGRSVIVPDPQLKIDECGIPLTIFLEVYKHLLTARLFQQKVEDSKIIKDGGQSAEPSDAPDRGSLWRESRREVQEHLAQAGNNPRHWKFVPNEFKKLVVDLCKTHPVLINRQPTLHRLGIQAFYPRITSHCSISLHPLVTAGFNADFDGDTMAIYLPISQSAIEEAEKLLPSRQLISPATGLLTLNLSQDLALGAYHLSSTPEGREKLKRLLDLPIPGPLTKSHLESLLKDFIIQDLRKPSPSYVETIDKLKPMLFESVTTLGASLGLWDFPEVTAEKLELMENVERGQPTKRDKQEIIEAKRAALRAMEDLIMAKTADSKNTLKPIVVSGARGNKTILNQIMGMKGEIRRTFDGRVFDEDNPFVFSSYREGLSLAEYFGSAYGARTDSVDKKLGTSDAGYLTRQLIELTQSVSITEEDCWLGDDAKKDRGVLVNPWIDRWISLEGYRRESLMDSEAIRKIVKDKRVLSLMRNVQNLQEGTDFDVVKKDRPFDDTLLNEITEQDPQIKVIGVKIREQIAEKKETRIKRLENILHGRVLAHDFDLDSTEKIPVNSLIDEKISERLAECIEEKNLDAYIRSPITCQSKEGVCQKCYGYDLSIGRLPEVNTRVGVLAAQSIGEPGTQMVLRTFHSGGVKGDAVIVQDIQAVETFLNSSTLSAKEIRYAFQDHGHEKASQIQDDAVLTKQLIDDIEAFYVSYRINRKHFEVVLKQMLGVVEITDQGKNQWYKGQIVRREEFLSRAREGAKGLQLFSSARTVAVLNVSWLASAAFERAPDVLAFAAISREKDRLRGLKENVALGRLLPEYAGSPDAKSGKS